MKRYMVIYWPGTQRLQVGLYDNVTYNEVGRASTVKRTHFQANDDNAAQQWGRDYARMHWGAK